MSERRRYEVVVEAHTVQWHGLANHAVIGVKYDVAEHVGIYTGEAKVDALRQGINAAHRDSLVPPLRSLLRQSVEHTSATIFYDNDKRRST